MVNNKEKLTCSLKLETLNDFDGIELHLKPNKTYSLVIDYPLNDPYIHKVKTGKKGLGLIGIFKAINRAYEYAFAFEKKNAANQVRTYQADNLLIKTINVNHKKKQIKLITESY